MKVRITKCNGNPDLLISGDDCEIVEEITKMKIGDYVIPLLHNHDKEPAVITKISEGLGYQVKYSGGTRFWYQENQLSLKGETMKEYEAAQDIMGVPAGEIKVVKQSSGIKSFQFYEHIKTLIINPQYIEGLLSKGIIAEKKSANDELAERIIDRIGNTQSIYVWSEKKIAYKEIILSELEKAGVK